MKRVFIGVAVLLFSICHLSVFALESDFYPYARYLAENDIIVPHVHVNEYRLYEFMLRQEMAALAYKLQKMDSEESYTCKNYYKDVSSNIPNGWACQVIEKVADAGIVTRNGNGRFYPESPVRRTEALAILLKSACIKPDERYIPEGYEFDEWPEDWEERVIATGYAYGFTSHLRDFRPHDPATRGELFVYAKKAHEYILEGSCEPDFQMDESRLISGEAKLN